MANLLVYCAHAILIELLIVVAILGIIAAVIIPNVGAFTRSGTLNAANTEAMNVRLAGTAFYAEQDPPSWPGEVSGDADADIAPYYDGTIKGTYTWTDGVFAGTDSTYDDDLYWDADGQKWTWTAPAAP